MTYKTIAVYLPAPDAVKGLMAVALPLAETFKAHLRGFHVHAGFPVAGTIGAQVPAEVIEQYMDIMREDAKTIEKAFAKSVAKVKTSTEWLEEEDVATTVDILSAVSAQTRCADLVVLGQPDAKHRSGELTTDIILSAGRPALIIPTDAKPLDLAGKVVVGWDGSREAARAAFDALPFLQRAATVHVVTVGKGADVKDAVKNGGVTLAEALVRHGVKAEIAMIAKGDSSAGEALSAYVAEQDAALLVMGCYGHSRLRERLFGGATIHVLEHMKSPVLMSH